MTKRGAYKRPASRPTNTERIAKLEGRLDGLAEAFAELASRTEKVEVAVGEGKNQSPCRRFDSPVGQCPEPP